jgi:hypothetical protein
VSPTPGAATRKMIPRSLLRLLLAAAILHVALVIAIALLGNSRALPQTFDTFGVGTSFAIDSSVYRTEAEKMARLMQQGRFQEWWNYNARLRSSAHVRPYSLAFALLGPLTGYRMLAAEPLNLGYYLAILALTFAIGAEVFSRRTGLVAAIAVGLWPSLLLYTTQMLRDPLAILATLLLVLCVVISITRSLSLIQAVAIAATGALALLLLWLCKAETWELIYLVLFLAAVFCAIGQIKERRFAVGRTMAMVALLLFAFSLPRALPMFRLGDLAGETMIDSPRAASDRMPDAVPLSGGSSPWTGLVRQVGFLRHRFIIRYPSAGSNVDTNVELRGTGDMIRYFPRAVAIGFLTPFPNMWFERGVQTGVAGRLLTGGETLIMYLIIALMAIGLARHRSNLLVWVLFTTAAAGCIALAYVVVNISSLYRMRYPFFILVIILGAAGAVSLWGRSTTTRSTRARS